ncbi:uncharacterized protein LOC126419062 [Schistocerca serialis cubense]|uniref:uncharacterized protein LOC126419062 n=1 Tax=Schistocerca serialis cubense TaxID=2023355 RepID=UPI00214F5EA8|nr:uncharacterized protein LOC126419062 [Schistocerca serialis cubense]
MGRVTPASADRVSTGKSHALLACMRVTLVRKPVSTSLPSRFANTRRSTRGVHRCCRHAHGSAPAAPLKRKCAGFSRTPATLDECCTDRNGQKRRSQREATGLGAGRC